MVGVTGFEPTASWSRTKRATKLRYTPTYRLSDININLNLRYISYHTYIKITSQLYSINIKYPTI